MCVCFLTLSLFFFFSSRRRHTRWPRDWSSDVCSSDLHGLVHDLRDDARTGVDHPPGVLARELGVVTDHGDDVVHVALRLRSEERRVGKEGMSALRAFELKKNRELQTHPDNAERIKHGT